MRRWILTLTLILGLTTFADGALEGCVTQTSISGSHIVTCTTCCYPGSYCTTTCY